MPVNDLYTVCRERFLVTSQITLNSHLTEFKDHDLVKTSQKTCRWLGLFVHTSYI
ncbi:hypothetical protein FRX31_016367, partial [Thalictrum thalictroides]